MCVCMGGACDLFRDSWNLNVGQYTCLMFDGVCLECFLKVCYKVTL